MDSQVIRENSPKLMTGGLQPDFLSWIRSVLVADSDLVACVSGGFWHLEAPPGTPNAFVVYMIPDNSRELIAKNKYLEQGKLQFSVYASTPEDGVTISNYIDYILSNIELQNSDIVWYNGRLQYLMRSDEPTPADPVAGYGGSNILGEISIYDYIYNGQVNLPILDPNN